MLHGVSLLTGSGNAELMFASLTGVSVLIVCGPACLLLCSSFPFKLPRPSAAFE